ncbi:hypothetical protein [Solwaraspora sp. WMMA2101]|uniref:hypothetical protein n=1 Tax=Solwaraspora sp. WMMA2101 TaxID=3404124 RepID=UPI003B936742
MTRPRTPSPTGTAAAPAHRAALDAMLGRLPRIHAAVGDRFPLYADPATGEWTSTRRGSWTGGFWAGLHWLSLAVHPDTLAREQASTVTGRLSARAGDDTVTRAMTFWYGAAATGGRLCRDPAADQVAAVGARALAASFEPGYGVFPVGTAFGGPPQPRIGIDALAAVVALMCWADEPSGDRRLARRHARACARLLVTDEGQVLAERTLPADRPPPAREQVWARGQAWGMLGFAVAADRLGGEFTSVARRVTDWWLATAGPPGAPPAVFGRAGAPLDSSAAAIAAAAMWTLGGQPARWAQRYRQAATATVDALVVGHLADNGALRDGCYDPDRDIACRHELIWGDYFLAAVLAIRCGAVPVAAW